MLNTGTLLFCLACFLPQFDHVRLSLWGLTFSRVYNTSKGAWGKGCVGFVGVSYLDSFREKERIKIIDRYLQLCNWSSWLLCGLGCDAFLTSLTYGLRSIRMRGYEIKDELASAHSLLFYRSVFLNPNLRSTLIGNPLWKEWIAPSWPISLIKTALLW